MTKNSTCVVCHGRRRRRWQDDHRAEVSTARKKWRKLPRVRDQERAAARKWRIANPENVREYKQREFQRHKVVRRPQYAALTAKRRAAKLLATPRWANHRKIDAIYRLARDLSVETGIQHHVDHIVPLRGKMVCGLHVETNLRVITAAENMTKHGRLIEELVE